MGNDCRFVCFDCNGADVNLGRAYHYNTAAMNKKINEETYEKLMLVIQRSKMSLQQIDIFGPDYKCNWFDEQIDFLKYHKGHDVWLIDDYFEVKKNDQNT